jgi:regulator of protease activity HflC (stomatin/prohibitin superfamily)
VELVIPLVVVVVVAALVVSRSVVIVPAGQAVVVERLGRYRRTLRQGLHVIAPVIDAVRARHALDDAELALSAVPAITLDNHAVAVDGALRVAVADPEKATYAVADYREACAQSAGTALRDAIAARPIADARAAHDGLGREVADAAGRTAAAWGVRVTGCEIRAIRVGRAAERPL